MRNGDLVPAATFAGCRTLKSGSTFTLSRGWHMGTALPAQLLCSLAGWGKYALSWAHPLHGTVGESEQRPWQRQGRSGTICPTGGCEIPQPSSPWQPPGQLRVWACARNHTCNPEHTNAHTHSLWTGTRRDLHKHTHKGAFSRTFASILSGKKLTLPPGNSMAKNPPNQPHRQTGLSSAQGQSGQLQSTRLCCQSAVLLRLTPAPPAGAWSVIAALASQPEG